MAFTDFERAINLQALDWFMTERRPPKHIRPKLDLGYVIDGQTVDLFSIRPDWKDRSVVRHEPIARVKFVRTREQWCLYWMRSDMRWHGYEPDPVHSTLHSALKTVNTDLNCCFFG